MRKLVGALLVLAPATMPAFARAQDADLIVLNAVVHTMDPRNPRAEALAIAGGEIVAVGDSLEVERRRGPGTPTVT
jgi:predicted amidohydrolase YtcJ